MRYLNEIIKFIANAIEIFLNGVIKFIATKANKYHFWWLLLIFLLLLIDPIRIRVIDILDGIPFWFPIAFFLTLYFSSDKFRNRIINVIVNGTLIPIYEEIKPKVEEFAETVARFIKRKREAESGKYLEFSEPTENKKKIIDEVLKTSKLDIKKALNKIEEGKEEEGLEDLQNLASKMPQEKSASVWRLIGEIAYNNHTQKALNAYLVLCNSEYFKTWDKIHLGRLFIRLDNIGAADSIFKEALKSLPVNEKRNKMILLSAIGDICMMKQEWQIALKNYQSAFEITQSLTQKDPENNQLQRDLSVNYSKIGEVYQEQEKLDEALKNYQKAFKIDQSLTQKDPENNQWQRDLSVTYNKIGEVYQAQGNLDEALENHQKSFQIAQSLTQKDPENNEWQRDLAVSHDKIAGTHKLKKYFPKAIKNYEIALEIFQTLSQNNSEYRQYKIDVADILCELGETYKLQNKISKALGYLQKANGIILPITKDITSQEDKRILEKIETLLKELESEN